MGNVQSIAATSRVHRPVGIIGVPLSWGADMAGVELGPAVMRVAGLKRRIAQLGYEVHDHDDLELDETNAPPPPSPKAKHLYEISRACEQLFLQVRSVLTAGALPIVLGGDHSIAIGSISSVSSYCHDRNETVGL